MSPVRELTFSIRGLGWIEDHGTSEVMALGRLVERAGFDQIWSGNDFLDVGGMATLTALLMATEQVKVASGVFDPVTFHPGQLAQQASALQLLSGGRFILGIGAGSDAYYRKASIPHDKPVPRTREALSAIRSLTSGQEVRSSYFSGPDAGLAELAFPVPVPLYVGAMGPRLLEMAGRYADGVVSLCLPPGHVREVTHHVEKGAAAAGRSIADVDVAAGIWCGVSDDPAESRALLRHQIALMSGSLSPDALAAEGLDPTEFAHVQQLLDRGMQEEADAAVTPAMMTLGIVGGPNDVIDQCAVLLDAGVRHISFGPPLGADKPSAIELLGRRVIPELRRLSAAG